MADNIWCCSTCDLLHLSGLIFMACKSLGSHRRSKFSDVSVVSPVISDLKFHVIIYTLVFLSLQCRGLPPLFQVMGPVELLTVISILLQQSLLFTANLLIASPS